MRRYRDGGVKTGAGVFKDRRFAAVCAALIILILIAGAVNKSLKPIGFRLAKAYGSDAVISEVNDCVSDYFEEADVGYSDLVKLRYGPSGMVTAMEYNAGEINRIKLGCLEKISKRLEKFHAAKIKVPVGSLFGDVSLSGFGPGVTVRISAKAVPNVELISRVESAGVNQSRHEIIMRVTAEVSIYLPPQTDSFTVVQDYVLAQTVIAGDVPQGNILIE